VIPRARASDLLARWAEPAIAAALTAWLGWRGAHGAMAGAPVGWLLAAMAVATALWTRAAIARARLSAGAQGLGVVSVTERRITYFGPAEGGALTLDGIALVVVETRAGASPVWRLTDASGASLRIPADASGAGRLTDALAALPGFSTARAADAIATRASSVRVVWRRPREKTRPRASRVGPPPPSRRP